MFVSVFSKKMGYLIIFTNLLEFPVFLIRLECVFIACECCDHTRKLEIRFYFFLCVRPEAGDCATTRREIVPFPQALFFPCSVGEGELFLHEYFLPCPWERKKKAG